MKKFLLFFLIIPMFVAAQKLPSIEDKTKGMKKLEGFFNFYLDEDNGKIWLEINKLNTEVLYQTSLPAGLGSNDIGLDRGLSGETRIVKFVKVGRKILMIQPNYEYLSLIHISEPTRQAEISYAQSTL